MTTRGYKKAPKPSVISLKLLRDLLRSAFRGSEIIYLSPRKYLPAEGVIMEEIWKAYEAGKGLPFQRRRPDGGLDYLFRVTV